MKESYECAEFLRMMDADSLTEEERKALCAHTERCPQCAAEEKLRRLIRESAYAPPPTLRADVLRAVRAEKARRSRRVSLSRVAAAVCAAVILIPTAVLLAPRLAQEQGDSLLPQSAANGAAGSYFSGKADAEDVPMDAVLTNIADEMDGVEDGVPSVPALSSVPETLAASDATENEASDAPAFSAGASVPPTDATGENVPQSTEPPFYAKLRAVVGEEAFDAWLEQYDGAPENAERAAYEYFGLDE